MAKKYKRLAQLRTAEDFRAYLDHLGLDLPFDDELQTGQDAPLAQPIEIYGKSLPNRFAVLPMEGWDGTSDGRPTDFTRRRWKHFGISGAKLIFGGEAVAVRRDGRANPRQLMILEETLDDLAGLRDVLINAHQERFGTADDLLTGLQLTHSGRFCRPYDHHALEPRTAYRHPILDEKFGITDDSRLLSDDDLGELVATFINAAVWVQQLGFDFVDIKHCHGYLGHELLSAIDRPGRYGGGFENRTRFLRDIVAGIREKVPGLEIAVRLSAADLIPFRPGPEHTGEPVPYEGDYHYAFGGDSTGLNFDLNEPHAFLNLAKSLGIELVCITVGSPYYNPHIQRPALFPPSDGYLPPEDPLAGVARQIAVTAEFKQAHPDLLLVGSGYSYLQEWLPNVAQAVIRQNMADFVGLGRMILAYPEMPADILAGNTLQRKRICRTFSDCTTAPRSNLVSGCYPLDDYYKNRPENAQLAEAKQALKS